MLGAAGAGGSNEWYLNGKGYTTEFGGYYSYYYNSYHNVVVDQNDGMIYTIRHSRFGPGNLGNYVWEQWGSDGTSLKYSQGTTGQINRVYYGRPKIDYDQSGTYDYMDVTDSQSVVRYVTTGSGSSPYGNYKNFNASYNTYSPNSWTGAKIIKMYNIGNRTYVAKGGSTVGGSIGGWQHTSTSYPFGGLSPGLEYTHNSTPGGGSFIDMFPINPASQSTNHVVWYSSSYSTDAFIVDSNLEKTGSNNARATNGGGLLQYWANGAMDRTNNTLYMKLQDTIYQWNYVNNTATSYGITGLSGSVRGQSDWMCVVNGYLYTTICTNGSGMYVIKMDVSNLTSNVASYKIDNTSGGSTVGNQEGFLVEAANSYLGDSDLLLLGFTNKIDGTSAQTINLAQVKFDTIPDIATHASNLSISSGGVGLSSYGSWATAQNPPGSNGLATQYANAPSNQTAYWESSSGSPTSPLPWQMGNPSISVYPATNL
tara:strand:+ start:1070 stop:2515 length:1446 start_codon:yes stop_codon:yes gene_type:complete